MADRDADREVAGEATDSDASVGSRVADAVRSSYLYRWLTAEPDPDVIVIDLRETRTVGPFIRLLDAVLDRLLPAVNDSGVTTVLNTAGRYVLKAPAVVAGLALLIVGFAIGLASVVTGNTETARLGLAATLAIVGAITTRERRSWRELRETKPVAIAIAALEPPEPPEQSEPAKSDRKGTNRTAEDNSNSSDLSTDGSDWN
jgi:hypothetical protein